MAALTYPRPVINIQDNSGGSTVTTQVASLHAPFFFIQAEQGPIGIPVLGTLAQHQATFGVNTFDPMQKFYSHQTQFAVKALQYQQVYLIRLADNTVSTANLIVEVTLSQASIPQYVTDALGARIFTSAGAPTPEVDASGVAISQPGYTISWSTRNLASTENINSLAVTTSLSGGSTSTTYPMLGFIAPSPGSGPNNSGLSLYYTTDSSPTIETDVQSILYRFAPVTLAAGNSGVTTPVTDIFTQNYNDVSLRQAAVDPNTAQDVSLNGILFANYQDADGNNLLDYTATVYSANVQAVGLAILAVSPELAGTDPFLINALAGIDANGNPYQHCIVEASLVGSSSAVLYLSGGSDGATDRVTFESLVAAFVQGEDNVEFQDQFRYPFTHFYDSGFSLANKFALMNILALRDDVVGTFSTQDTSDVPNTQAQDQSSGAAILARARTYPESVLYGTEAMRVEIYNQSGYLAASNGISGVVALTIDRMVKRCTYYSGPYVKGSPKGRPNSEVTLFKKIFWTAATQTQKQLNWDTALNTVSYADISTLFYPDLRSIYVDQTSLLSDGVFVDLLVFLKHIARNKWTYYAGRDDPAVKLFSTIAQDIDTTCNTVFGGALPTKTVVSQTDADQKAGYASTVTISVNGDLPNRVWNVVIPVSRTAVAAAA